MACRGNLVLDVAALFLTWAYTKFSYFDNGYIGMVDRGVEQEH
jgi:hypothetical protein